MKKRKMPVYQQKEMVERIQAFLREMDIMGVKVSVQFDGATFGGQVTSMPPARALGFLKLAEIQITNGMAHHHHFDAMVQSIEQNPDLAKRYVKAMHAAHEEKK